MTAFDWFTPHTPVVEQPAEEDEFNETLRMERTTEEQK